MTPGPYPHEARLLSLIAANIRDMVVFVDLEGRIQWVNEAVEKQFGYTREELIGAHVYTLQAPEKNPPGIWSPGGTGELLEKWAGTIVDRRKDGSEFTSRVESFLVRDGHGSVTGIASISRDISDKARAEQRLRESEKRYRAFFATSRDGVFITSAGGEWIDFNDAALEIFGYKSREGLLQVPVSSVYANPEERSALLALIEKQGSVKEYPVRLRRRDGTVIDALITSGFRLSADGSGREYFGTIRDITARKKAEDALRASERKVRALFDQAFQFIGLMTVDGILVEANRAALEFSGVEASTVLNKPFWQTPWWTHSPELQEKLRHAVEKAARGEFIRFEVTHTAKNGVLHDIDFSLKPVKDETGKVIFLIPEGRDITERSKTYARIHALNQMQAMLLDRGTQEEKLKKITEGIIGIFHADFSRIWLIRPGDRCASGCVHAAVTEGPHVCRSRARCLHLIASSGRYTHITGAHQRVPLGCYKIGGIASGEYASFLTNDVVNDPRVHDREWARQLGLVSFCGFQLRSPHGETEGVLALFSRHAISPEEHALLENISNLTVRAIQTAQAEEALLARNRELEIISSAALTREFRIKELRDEIRALKRKLAGGGEET